MSSDNEKEYYDCTIKKGLSLYHITPLNIISNHEEHEHLISLPEDQEYGYDLTKPMYFGLSEHFTIYYDVHYNHKHLQFVTKRDLRLLNIGTIKKPLDFNELKELGYDGWIARDGEPETWLEVMILKPQDSVEFVRELNHEDVEMLEYPSGIDEIILNAYTTKCDLVEDL